MGEILARRLRFTPYSFTAFNTNTFFMERENVEEIIKGVLMVHGLEAGEALKIFGEFRKKYGDALAYVYTLANVLAEYEKPPLVDLDAFGGGEVLRILASKIRAADYSPYKELLDIKMFYCAAEYAYEKEGAALLAHMGRGYLLDFDDIPAPE